MAVGWRVVVHLYYGASQRYVSSYHTWFQYFFILVQLLRGKCSYEQFVGEYCDVLVVSDSMIVVWPSGEGVCTAVVLSGSVLQLDIVFFKLKYLSCNTSANLLRLSPVREISVVGVDYDFVG